MENTHKRFNFITWFREMWTSHPLFSTTCALLLMIILQTAALGFDQGSFGEWFSIWSRNWINILRNNATIGIIALGMTFVIITGGIDLAVRGDMGILCNYVQQQQYIRAHIIRSIR